MVFKEDSMIQILIFQSSHGFIVKLIQKHSNDELIIELFFSNEFQSNFMKNPRSSYFSI